MKKLCFAKEVFRAVYEFENKLKKKYDISLNEALSLCALNNGKMKAGKLAEEVGLSVSRMSRILKSMEKKGYVSRHVGDEDCRTMFFLLTKKGNDKLDSIDDSSLDLPYFDSHMKCSE